jgi:signal transduction histidine kinase/CheY-like chemotaxis protein/predicted Ser/Thr protein kinase
VSASSGQQIPGIHILDELGRGAHSVVYRALQDGTPCAVKLPSVRARWTRWIYREAIALARVKHRALPAVLEVGEIDGLPYLVMELIAGETLASRMQIERLDESVCIALLSELLDALSAVHDAGLVHRDVKPRNIIIESGSEALKLVDFGFATPIERVGREDAAGTAAYAAPEQLVMPGRVDGRTDLYAVGRVLFECLTGRSLATRQKPGPFAADVRAELIAAAVSVGLAEIIAGLLRRDPEDRYPEARAVKAELERMARGEPLLGPAGYEVDRCAKPLVARAVELEHIVDFLTVAAERRARRDDPEPSARARGAVVVVSGARGAGKSRLLSAVAGRARELGSVIEVSCTRDEPPLSTLRRILEGYVASTKRGRPAPGDDDFLAGLGKLAAVATLIAPSLGETKGGPTSGSSVPSSPGAADTLSEGAAEILLRVASRRPLYLFIDDIHWMDPASADALIRVAHRASEAPLVLVLGSRSGSAAALAGRFKEARPKHSLVVELGTLAEAQVGALVASHLGERSANDALVRRVHAMADGTVLGVLEVLGAFLDAGAVRPHARTWQFDVARADRVVLPSGSLALLGRRLGELPAATHRVLEAAAVIGTCFEDQLLGQIVELTVDDLGFGMAAARRAGLVEPQADGSHRFVHDSLREMLLEGIEPSTRRLLHQLVAEALASQPAPTFDVLCAIAMHLVNGEIEKAPSKALDACRVAARAALDRFSNETALEYLEHARKAAARIGTRLDAAHHRAVGEAQLRLGRLDESHAAFESALEVSTDPKERATLLGRLAWVYQTRAEPKRASDMLERAFLTLGVRMPVGTVGSAARTALSVAGAKARRYVERSGTLEHAEIELLSGLHYQNARLGLEYGEPLRLMQSSAEALELSKLGASPRATARARAIHGFVLMAMRLHDAGVREFSKAEAIAAEQQDPVTTVFCVQLRSSAALYAGSLDLGIELARECVDIFGPWLELNEYCYHIANVELIQALRGRSTDAWSWLERGLDRLRRSNTRPAVVEYLVHRARATMGALGREPSLGWMATQFNAVPPSHAGQGYHRLLSWGPRARWYVERADLGDELEELIRAFEAEHPDPRSAHVVLSEYYVAVAHARMFQALRASALDRDRCIVALRRAAADLSVVAKYHVLRAHSLLTEGCLASLEGNERKASKLLAEAEALADDQSCPWVLYGIARTRAHKLRAEGRGDAARDQALIAETLASQHGALHRARWIRDEFALPAVQSEQTAITSSTSSSRRSSRTNRQLAALINVAQAPRRDLKAEQQAGRILEELMGSIQAAGGAIWFQPEPNTSGTAVFRHRGSDVSVAVGADSPHGALLRSVHQSGKPWPPLEGEPRTAANQPFDPKRMIAVPLNLYEKPVGALCLERIDDDPPFAPDDRSLLELLSHQVPITLEIARLLFEREQLQTSLQQAKKMEAMGQLAGGLAHDFNNMLAAMKVALSAARERATLDAELTVELDIISQATTRAAQLTSQLLSFSRHQPVPVAVHDVNQLISTLEPMLRRVVGSKVTVATNLSPAVDAVEVDQGSFDQALVNLLINARDAMPNGGTLTITTRNVLLGDATAQRNNLPPGAYVEIEVADTGEGMSPETLSRIFEPFFTTKPSGSGSGLGLAMVYAFARNCGGSIDVSSELGQGTQFRVYLKRVERRRTSRPARSLVPATVTAPSPPIVTHEGPDTILIVDDDDLVRRSIAKILERHGYRVLAASGSVEALDVAREHGSRIGLVILDVLMPGVTGPELGRRLYDLNLSAKLLFVSGYSPESIPLEEAQVAAEMLLQKPFSQTALLERVRQLMHH